MGNKRGYAEKQKGTSRDRVHGQISVPKQSWQVGWFRDGQTHICQTRIPATLPPWNERMGYPGT